MPIGDTLTCAVGRRPLKESFYLFANFVAVGLRFICKRLEANFPAGQWLEEGKKGMARVYGGWKTLFPILHSEAGRM